MRAPAIPSTESRGLYIHVPFCDGKCLYCAFYSVRYTSAQADAYLRGLARELERLTRAFPGFVPDTIYCGGGTPTALSAPQLARLLAAIRRFAGDRAGREWTVEANPNSLTAEKLDLMTAAGVNRVSLGAQAFDAATLARLGRRHTAAQVEQACGLIRAAGIGNFGLDLIACVPGVALRQWRAALEAAVALGPRHLSVYALTVEEGSRLQRRAAAGEFHPLREDEELAALHAAAAVLRRGGFERYEISNYARPGFACRHNVACWRGGDYLGAGPAAAARIGLQRWTNTADLAAWQRALARGQPPPAEAETLTPETAATEELIFGLRLTAGIDLAAIVTRHGLAGTAAAARWTARLAELARAGLARRAGARWRLTPRGLDLADHAAVELMS